MYSGGLLARVRDHVQAERAALREDALELAGGWPSSLGVEPDADEVSGGMAAPPPASRRRPPRSGGAGSTG